MVSQLCKYVNPFVICCVFGHATLMWCVLHVSMQVYLVVEEFMYYFGYSKFFSINEAQLPLSNTGPELGDLGKVETNTDSLLLL